MVELDIFLGEFSFFLIIVIRDILFLLCLALDFYHFYWFRIKHARIYRTILMKYLCTTYIHMYMSILLLLWFYFKVRIASFYSLNTNSSTNKFWCDSTMLKWTYLAGPFQNIINRHLFQVLLLFFCFLFLFLFNFFSFYLLVFQVL